MTARTGGLVTVSRPFFGSFSHASFASLVGPQSVYYSTFSHANFASMVAAGAPKFYPFTQSRQGAWSRTFNAGWLPDLETPMSVVQVLQNTATTISVFMRDAATGLGLPGITPASFVIKLKKSNQVVFSTITPTVTDTGLGWYDLAITAAHASTYGKAPLEIAAPGALTRDDLVLDVIALNKFTDPVHAGLSALPNADAGTSEGVALYKQVQNIAVTSAALNKIAASRLITTGTGTGGIGNTVSVDLVYDNVADVGGVIDFYYEFTLASITSSAAVEIVWTGYLVGVVNMLNVYAFNWNTSVWDQLGTVAGIAGTTNGDEGWGLTNDHTGTGGNLGRVRIRFQNTGLTAATLKTDQILVGYVVLPATSADVSSSTATLAGDITTSQGVVTTAITTSQGVVTTAIATSQGVVTTAITTSQGVVTTAIAASQTAILAAIPSAATIRDAILNALRSGHVALGTVGEGIAIATSLLQGNFYMDQVTNTANGQTASRMRCFHTGLAAAAATPGGTGEGEFATFLVATSYSGPNKISDHRVVQQ